MFPLLRLPSSASARRLSVFKAVVDLGGFNAAADRLGIAQYLTRLGLALEPSAAILDRSSIRSAPTSRVPQPSVASRIARGARSRTQVSRRGRRRPPTGWLS